MFIFAKKKRGFENKIFFDFRDTFLPKWLFTTANSD